MVQEIKLAPRECARNAGLFMLIRMLLGLIIYFPLVAVFPIPQAWMLSNIVSIKTNVFLFIGLIIGIFFTSLFGLVVGFPTNNVMKSVNEKVSVNMMRFRIIENLLFVGGMILLISENPYFHITLGTGLIFYGLSLFLLGYLVFASGYLQRITAIGLMAGGLGGYVPLIATQLIIPSIDWLTTAFAYTAILSEVGLAIIFIVTARKIKETDPVETITVILKRVGAATTKEITEEAAKISAECPDRVPETLRELELENRVSKKLSKEKKGYVWFLIEEQN